MNKKFVLAAIFVLLMFLNRMPVAAGGWAVITLDDLPDTIMLNESYQIGFMVRQHGIRLMEDLSPMIVAEHTKTGESIQFNAVAQGAVGHYVAELMFTQPGIWRWSIHAFTMEHHLPQLTVISAPGHQVDVNSTSSPKIGIIGFGLLAAAAGISSVILLRNRRNIRMAVALLIGALLFTGGGFALAANRSTDAASDFSQARTPIIRGEALFVSKGCITCHMHATVAEKYDVVSGFSGPAGIAPDLSNYAANPAFLRMWLADPTEVKPGTTMPDLNLSVEEIDALVSFLTKDADSLSDNELSGIPPENCPVTQPPDLPFTPPQSYPFEAPTENRFWYGTDALWTMLGEGGIWRGLPYHEEGGGHYFNKVFWWNEDYNWQVEPVPAFTVTMQRLDDPAIMIETSDATNAYTPEFGSAILTGVEIPTPGCWEIKGNYKGHELAFVVWVRP